MNGEVRMKIEPPAGEPFAHKSRLFDERRDLDQIPRSARLQKRMNSPIGLSLVQLEEIGLLDSAQFDHLQLLVPTATSVPAQLVLETLKDTNEMRRELDRSRTTRRQDRDLALPAFRPNNHSKKQKQQRPLSAVPQKQRRWPHQRPASASSRVLRPEGWAPGSSVEVVTPPSSTTGAFELDDIIEDDGGGGLDPFEQEHFLYSGDGPSARAPSRGVLFPSDEPEEQEEPMLPLAALAEQLDGGSSFETTYELLEEEQPVRRNNGAQLERRAYLLGKTLRELVLARRRATSRSVQQIFAHFDRRQRRAFDGRDLLEGLIDLGVSATLGEAQSLLRHIARDNDAPLVRLGEFTVFVEDADHDFLEEDVCESLARRLLLSTTLIEESNGSLSSATDDEPILMDALSDAFDEEQEVDRRRFAQGLASLGLQLESRRAMRLVLRFDTDGENRCSVVNLARMVLRSRSWRLGVALIKARREAHSEAEVAAQLESRCGHWPEGLSAEIVQVAKSVGLRVFSDRELLWIAREALSSRLPRGWIAARDSSQRWFYHHPRTGDSQWSRPVAERYELMAIEAQRSALSRSARKANDQFDQDAAYPVTTTPTPPGPTTTPITTNSRSVEPDSSEPPTPASPPPETEKKQGEEDDDGTIVLDDDDDGEEEDKEPPAIAVVKEKNSKLSSSSTSSTNSRRPKSATTRPAPQTKARPRPSSATPSIPYYQQSSRRRAEDDDDDITADDDVTTLDGEVHADDVTAASKVDDDEDNNGWDDGEEDEDAPAHVEETSQQRNKVAQILKDLRQRVRALESTNISLDEENRNLALRTKHFQRHRTGKNNGATEEEESNISQKSSASAKSSKTRVKKQQLQRPASAQQRTTTGVLLSAKQASFPAATKQRPPGHKGGVIVFL